MLTILQGDVIEQLRTLPDESVHCCVTSPPYWGLRDYGTAQWDGGEDGCDHLQQATGATQNKGCNGRFGSPFREVCGKCGAKRIDSQIGLEKTPEEYVAKMVDVFREVRRVLRKDGTCWINLGDAYAHSCACGGGSPLSNPNDGRIGDQSPRGRKDDRIAQLKTGGTLPPGLKPKDLCGIPWRVAFALQADGWWLRSDIIWAKPNPMPESVTDRPTKAHEYLFLLTKASSYFYDAEAIKEKLAVEPHAPGNRIMDAHSGTLHHGQWTERNMEEVWGANGNRNKRSVWTVATAPYPEAHFATYPPDLIKPCVMAGTSAKGCCAKCGSPWERIVERGETTMRTPNDGKGYVASISQERPGLGAAILPNAHTPITTVGWEPTCRCYGDEPIHQTFVHELKLTPCTVLDPFAGSGTTGAVALELGRKSVLIELNPKYVELIKTRCNITPGL